MQQKAAISSPIGLLYSHTSPRYEVVDTKEFQVSVHFPGVKPGDINVASDKDGSVLSIRG